MVMVGIMVFLYYIIHLNMVTTGILRRTSKVFLDRMVSILVMVVILQSLLLK